MGAYLSAPVTEKKAFDGETSTLRYGGSAMQGWRRNMEDAHFVHPTIDNSNDVISVFGVFDGHGGCEVARFCEKYLPTVFPSVEGFPDNMELALSRVFHKMDEMLKEDCYRSELEEMRMSGESNGDNEQQESSRGGIDAEPTNPSEAFLRQFDLMKKLMIPQNNNNNTTANPNNNNSNSNSNSNSNTNNNTECVGSTTTSSCNSSMTTKGGPIGEISSPANEESGSYDSFPASMVQAGATAIVAVLKGKDLYVANAGDSRGVLCRGIKAIPLSEDHKPGLDSERLRIEAAGGFLSEIAGMYRVNGNLNLSRAIGDLRYKSNSQLNPKDQIITAEPDVKKLTISKEDKFFVLACDGVWDVMDNQQVVDFILKGLEKGQTHSDVASALLDNCLALDPKTTRGVGCDNMTCLITTLLQNSDSLEGKVNQQSEGEA